MWTIKQVLESFMHSANCFVTLTYNDEHIPEHGSLCPEDLKNFHKRLRQRLFRKDGIRYRHFSVGEYGDLSWRPHYHLSLFGVSVLMHEEVEKAWMLEGKSLGYVHIGDFNEYSAQYVAGYTVKKMTQWDHPALEGLHPEFARFSLKPGLGATAMGVIADQLCSDAGVGEYLATGDVPSEIRFKGKKWQLGRYLRKKLREELNVPEEEKNKAVERYFKRASEEVCGLLLRARHDGEELTPQAAVSKENAERVRQLTTREKIQRSKRG